MICHSAPNRNNSVSGTHLFKVRWKSSTKKVFIAIGRYGMSRAKQKNNNPNELTPQNASWAGFRWFFENNFMSGYFISWLQNIFNCWARDSRQALIRNSDAVHFMAFSEGSFCAVYQISSDVHKVLSDWILLLLFVLTTTPLLTHNMPFEL
jgi:hypothetical protein